MSAQQQSYSRVSICARCNRPVVPTAGDWIKQSGQVCVCVQPPVNGRQVLSLSREDLDRTARLSVKSMGKLVTWTINVWPAMAGVTMQIRYRPFNNFRGEQPLSDCIINVAL